MLCTAKIVLYKLCHRVHVHSRHIRVPSVTQKYNRSYVGWQCVPFVPFLLSKVGQDVAVFVDRVVVNTQLGVRVKHGHKAESVSHVVVAAPDLVLPFLVHISFVNVVRHPYSVLRHAAVPGNGVKEVVPAAVVKVGTPLKVVEDDRHLLAVRNHLQSVYHGLKFAPFRLGIVTHADVVVPQPLVATGAGYLRVVAGL